MTDGLHPKEQAILVAIRQHFQEHGYSPRMRDIQKLASLSSTSVVEYHLRTLEHKKYISRVPTKPGTIQLTEKGRAVALSLEAAGMRR